MNVPSDTDANFEPGDQILVWREKGHTQKNGEYKGPFKVASCDRIKKLVFIYDQPNGTPRPFSIAQVKHNISPSTLSSSFFSDLNHALTPFKSPSINDDIFITEIIPQKDPRSQTPEMQKAKLDEIRNLMKRGTFKVVLKEDIPDDANVLPGRFVLALKSDIDGKIIHKARFVIGGHRDKLKNFMVHSSQPCSHHRFGYYSLWLLYLDLRSGLQTLHKPTYNPQYHSRETFFYNLLSPNWNSTQMNACKYSNLCMAYRIRGTSGIKPFSGTTVMISTCPNFDRTHHCIT